MVGTTAHFSGGTEFAACPEPSQATRWARAVSSSRLRPIPFDHLAVSLTPEEGYVLSRIVHPVTPAEVHAVVGMERARAEAIVNRLLTIGVLALDREGEVASPSPSQGSGVRRRGSSPAAPELPGARDRRSSSRFAALDGADSPGDGAPRATDPPGPLPAAATGARARYEASFRGLNPSGRATKAQNATGSDLYALCYDPHPQVVLALLANPAFDTNHARVVAHAHQNASGLELLARDPRMLADVGVQRAYLGNPRLTAALLERVLAAASLTDLHQHATDVGLRAELQTTIGDALRNRFATAAAEEIADLVYWSDGEALAWGGGAPLSAGTVTRLSQRPITSEGLVRRLATYPGTPRSLLVVLDSQPYVLDRRDLRELIRRHPNAR